MDLQGRTIVIRLDDATLGADGATFFSDLVFLGNLGMRPVVVAPTAEAARAVVRTMNRSGDTAVGLTGADAGMIPAAAGETIGNVGTKLLRTLLDAGYVPVIEPLAMSFAGERRRGRRGRRSPRRWPAPSARRARSSSTTGAGWSTRPPTSWSPSSPRPRR